MTDSMRMTTSADPTTSGDAVTHNDGFVQPEFSLHTDLRLVGRAFRQARRSGVSRPEAERSALEVYCSFHPEASEAKAREAVAWLIKASSEAGMIWIDNH